MSFTGLVSLDQAVAGFVAGAASTLALHPLDLIKTRFQGNRVLLFEHHHHVALANGTWKALERI